VDIRLTAFGKAPWIAAVATYKPALQPDRPPVGPLRTSARISVERPRFEYIGLVKCCGSSKLTKDWTSRPNRAEVIS